MSFATLVSIGYGWVDEPLYVCCPLGTWFEPPEPERAGCLKPGVSKPALSKDGVSKPAL